MRPLNIALDAFKIGCSVSCANTNCSRRAGNRTLARPIRIRAASSSSGLLNTVAASAALGLATNKSVLAGILAALQCYRTIVGAFETEITGAAADLVEILWFELAADDPVAMPKIEIASKKRNISATALDDAITQLQDLGLIETGFANGAGSIVRTDFVVA